MNLREEAGFLGTDANLLADLTLLAYILILLPLMAAGFYFARTRQYEPQHKTIMTTITLLNWLLIGFVMLASFADYVAPDIPAELGDDFYLFPTLHLFTGGLAQVIATYLVIRMWFEDQLPPWFKVENIKRLMRATLGLWVVTALLGITIYFTWYGDTDSDAGSDSRPPPVTEETEEPVDSQ